MVALLGHSLMARKPDAATDMRSLAKTLEIALFRQLPGGHHLSGLAKRMEQARKLAEEMFAHPLVKVITPEQWDALTALAEWLEQVMAPLLDLSEARDGRPLSDLLHAHISVAEALSAGKTGVADRLWTGEAGAALSETLRELLDHAATAPALHHCGVLQLHHGHIARRAGAPALYTASEASHTGPAGSPAGAGGPGYSWVV